MTLQLQFVETASYLKVVVRGLCTDQNSIDAIRRVITEFDRSPVHRLLIDEHEMLLDAGVLTDAGVGNFIAEYLRANNHRIAVLGNPNSHAEDRCLETVANDNGNTIRFFYEESQATEWLLTESDDPQESE